MQRTKPDASHSVEEGQRGPSPEGKPPDSPLAYRLICLLDEVGKLFGSIIANRVVEYLSRQDPNLHDHRYGFWAGRLTTNAVLRLRAVFENRGGVTR